MQPFHRTFPRPAGRSSAVNMKVKLWDLSRVTAWRRVKDVLDAAGVEQSTKTSPKSFRHGFGVAAVSAGIPLNLVQRWLGHAQLTTTAIYADAVGAEEKIPERMW
jgi:integrase/recombinase XerD